eukprot:COSAG02_NODE_5425_length_4343_cov_2.410697_1_plen_264_part_10
MKSIYILKKKANVLQYLSAEAPSRARARVPAPPARIRAGGARMSRFSGLPLLVSVLAPLHSVVAVPLLAANSRVVAPIVLQDFAAVTVDASATSQERFAAEQLAHWLSQAILSNVSVVYTTPANESQVKVSHMIVGAGAAASALPSTWADQLSGRPEAYACRSSWGPHVSSTAEKSRTTIVLTGGVAQPRGTIIAVFEFLRDVGFRWWNAAHPNRAALTTIPAATNLVPACNRIFEPPIEYRLFNGHTVGAGDPMWRVQNHMYG